MKKIGQSNPIKRSIPEVLFEHKKQVFGGLSNFSKSEILEKWLQMCCGLLAKMRSKRLGPRVPLWRAGGRRFQIVTEKKIRGNNYSFVRICLGQFTWLVNNQEKRTGIGKRGSHGLAMYVGLSEFIYSNQTGTQIACQQVHFGAQARGVATSAKSCPFFTRLLRDGVLRFGAHAHDSKVSLLAGQHSDHMTCMTFAQGNVFTEHNQRTQSTELCAIV